MEKRYKWEGDMLKVINKNIKDLLHLFMYIAIYYLFRHLIKCNLFQEFKMGIFDKYHIQLICYILPLISIFYFFNSLIVLRCKKILNEDKIYINILNIVISSLVIGILQITTINSYDLIGVALIFVASILGFFFVEFYKTPINVLIVVVSYITLLSAQILITRKMKGLKDELKAIFLSLIVTIICILLLKINHIIIVIIIYDILYLFIGKKLEREV